MPKLVGAHRLNGPEPGIEFEPGRAFDATGAAETVVDVLRLRAALFVRAGSVGRLVRGRRGLILLVRISICRADRCAEHVPRKVHQRETQQERHRHKGETPVLLAEHNDLIYVRVGGNASLQVGGTLLGCVSLPTPP